MFVFLSGLSPKGIFLLVSGLLGGLGLFLFGMHTMSEGIQHSAGKRLRTLLEQVTKNRIAGALTGTLVTTIIQSSSATSVMLVSFVNAGLIQFRQSIPVLLGAALGTTITAQIIAFKITEYSLLLIALGFFTQSFSKGEKGRAIGSALFGFGVLFFGMDIMSEAMAPLRDWPPFTTVLTRLENPIAGIIIGAAFTALIQSSSAFIGIMIVLASQGLITLDAAIPLLLGANLGTPVTALIASLQSDRESKKVAFAFLLLKFFSVLIFAAWTGTLSQLLLKYAGDAGLPRLIAHVHTIINVVLMITMLPLSRQIARLIDWIMGREAPEVEEPFRTRYLDNPAHSNPALALNLARKEILRMGHLVEEMFSLIITPFTNKNAEPLSRVYSCEQEVNFLRDAIKGYLLALSPEARDKENLDQSFRLLYALEEFEKIADKISGNLASRAEKWILKDFDFSTWGQAELEGYHAKIAKQLRRSLELVGDSELEKAVLMKAKHKSYRNLSRMLEKQHYQRILEGIQDSVNSSKTHLELLTLFNDIDSRATNIARTYLEWENRKPSAGGKKRK